MLCKYIQMSAAALARRQEATEKALAECVDTVASLAAAQAKVRANFSMTAHCGASAQACQGRACSDC